MAIAIGAESQLSLYHAFSHGDRAGASLADRGESATRLKPGDNSPTQKQEYLICYPCIQSPRKMTTKSNKKTFHLNAVIDGHLISGVVALSPAPQPGIFTELARFEAERALAHAVREAIATGRL